MKMSTNKVLCRTYFSILGDFNPYEITKLLSIDPQMFWCAEDLKKNGLPYGFSFWKTPEYSNSPLDIEHQCVSVISLLESKIAILQGISKNNDVTFHLRSVPIIYGNQTPAIVFSHKVTEFCYLTKCTIDVDLYVNIEE